MGEYEINNLLAHHLASNTFSIRGELLLPPFLKTAKYFLTITVANNNHSENRSLTTKVRITVKIARRKLKSHRDEYTVEPTKQGQMTASKRFFVGKMADLMFLDADANEKELKTFYFPIGF
mgnify:CR=1 FL=1